MKVVPEVRNSLTKVSICSVDIPTTMVINYPRRHQSAYVSFAEYDILDIDKVASGSRTGRNIFHIRMKEHRKGTAWKIVSRQS